MEPLKDIFKQFVELVGSTWAAHGGLRSILPQLLGACSLYLLMKR